MQRHAFATRSRQKQGTGRREGISIHQARNTTGAACGRNPVGQTNRARCVFVHALRRISIGLTRTRILGVNTTCAHTERVTISVLVSKYPIKR